MLSLKIRLLICFSVLAVVSLLAWIYFTPKQVENPAATPVQTPDRETPVPDPRFERAAHNDKLQAETDALLPLFDRMPSVPIYVKDEPMLKAGTNTDKGAAYAFCDAPNSPLIFMKKIFYEKASRKQLVNALKHELTHAWLCRKGLPSEGHDSRFRQKFTQVGGFGN